VFVFVFVGNCNCFCSMLNLVILQCRSKVGDCMSSKATSILIQYTFIDSRAIELVEKLVFVS
jgi:hypothetical protein